MIQIKDWAGGFSEICDFDTHIITNADTGTLVTWNNWTPQQSFGMAITTGTSASVMGGPSLPDEVEAIVPVLQAQDGSFVGTAAVGPFPTQNYLVAFDASGSLRWSVAGDWQPEIATDDGGSLATDDNGSPFTFGSDGSSTGQMAGLPTHSWRWLAYRIGSVAQLQVNLFNLWDGLGAFRGGNPSGNGAAAKPQYTPERGLYDLTIANLRGDSQCKALLGQLAQIKNVSNTPPDIAIAQLAAQIQITANRARDHVHDGPSSNQPITDPTKFEDARNSGATTVGGWFNAFSGGNGYADGLSEKDSDDVWFRLFDWTSWIYRFTSGLGLPSRFIKKDGSLNSFAMGTLMHEILHKQTVGGGFNHEDMDTAVKALNNGNLITGSQRSPESLGIAKFCFANLQ